MAERATAPLALTSNVSTQKTGEIMTDDSKELKELVERIAVSQAKTDLQVLDIAQKQSQLLTELLGLVTDLSRLIRGEAEQIVLLQRKMDEALEMGNTIGSFLSSASFHAQPSSGPDIQQYQIQRMLGAILERLGISGDGMEHVP